jgi:hypothetical protein
MKLLYKYSGHIIWFLFTLGLLLEIIVKDHVKNEALHSGIDYYCWFSFGLLSGFYLAITLYQKRSQLERDENPSSLN